MSGEPARARWGVALHGHPFDLMAWEEGLIAGSDPWLERHREEYVLRSSRFDHCPTATEVKDEASELVPRLNSAFEIERHTRPLHVSAILEFHRNGLLSHNVGVMESAEASDRASISVLVTAGDGSVPLPPAAQPTR